MSKLENPIFILGCHKSGTSLLKNLLDGHPELFAIPSETHFFQYSGYWVDYALRRNLNITKTIEQQEIGLYQFFLYENTIKDPYGSGAMDGRYNEEKFREFMNENKSVTQMQLFDNYIRAIHYSLTGTNISNETRIVEKSVENSDFAIQIKRWYPTARFIHIVRNPYATITAIRKMKDSKGYPFLGPIIKSLHNSLYSMYKNQMNIDNYMIVKYEDLLTDPEPTMRNIAKHLDINFRESLLKPTLYGKKWKGNSTSNTEFSEITKSPINSWKNNITSIETEIVNKHLTPIIKMYNYDRELTKTSKLFLPQSREGFKNYCRNRMLLQTSSNDLF